MLELARALQERERRALRADLATFAKAAWRVLEPETPLQWSWHLDLLCEHLARVRSREERRLIVNVPPQTMKSRLVTVFFPCWCWTLTPERRFMAASYSAQLSTKHSLERRKLLSSGWYQQTFPGVVTFADDQNLKAQFQNNTGGFMLATSCGGTATGVGVDDIICDDLMNPQMADSDAERASANDFFDSTLRTRLSNQKTGAIVIVMQRLHQLDLTGHVLAKGESWTHISLPMETEESEHHVFPVSGRIVERNFGELLQPERFPREVVTALKTSLGAFRYAGQYQQRPVPAEGNIIKRMFIRYCGGVDPQTGVPDTPLPAQFDFKLISVDCAFKDSSSSDFVAIAVIGVSGRKRYILHVTNAHLGLTATEAEIRNLHAVHAPVTAVLVEDKANGPAVIDRLKLNLSGVIPLNPQGGKVSRLIAVSPEWEAGDWYLPRTAPWAEALIAQLTSFPAAPHDDMADAMSQAGIWLTRRAYVGTTFHIPGVNESDTENPIKDEIWEKIERGEALTERELELL